MTTILVVDGNPADLVAAGYTDYVALFLQVLHALDPSLHFRRAHPYSAPVPEALLDEVDAAVFTGSATDWATDAPEAAPQRAAMEQVFARALPVWGSCNGLQLAACLLGGAVGESPNGMELGLARDITLTEAGRVHPMMTGRKDGFAVPCIHRDEVQRLPQGAQLLASNAHSHVQAMAYAQGGVDFWGTQYHPELPPVTLAGSVSRMGGDPVLADHLLRAETDAAAARALGADMAALRLSGRSVELVNWLGHVRAVTQEKSRPAA